MCTFTVNQSYKDVKIIPSKKSKGLCQAYRCASLHSKKDRFCHKHRKRYQKEHNEAVYVFGMLKQNARRRNKPFKLTIRQFREFCRSTNYLENRGKNKSSATVDRIDPAKGYEVGNIQVMSLSDNSSKADKAPF